jgi:glycosyltransferase involved in cell wall biosynthesis
MNKISIVIPVKNEEENIDNLKLQLSSVLNNQSLTHFEFEIIINDNFSKDRSVKLIKEWMANDPRIILNEFHRDFGFQGSLILGMRKASGDALIVLQSDLQDPPELIIKFVESWKKGSKVVAGIIRKRNEFFLKSWFRNIFYWFLNISTDIKVYANFQDFYLLDRSVYETLRNSSLEHSFLRVKIAAEYGLDELIQYERPKRLAGKTKFNFSAMYNLALDALLLYGNRLNRILSIITFCSSICSFVLCISLILGKILGINYGQVGWLSEISIILLGLSLVFLILSVQIEFLFRIYKKLMQS